MSKDRPSGHARSRYSDGNGARRSPSNCPAWSLTRSTNSAEYMLSVPSAASSTYCTLGSPARQRRNSAERRTASGCGNDQHAPEAACAPSKRVGETTDADS